ncbi:MAG: repair protein RadA [Thermoproteota archaeon]|nr:repair protein RadA [Thermoproteota archaeon]
MVEAIRKLEDIPGVGAMTAQKLRVAGYYTLESVAVASTRELAEIVGISSDKALELSVRAREMLEISFQTAEELLKRRKEIARITTRSRALDNLLGGGVETQAILELIGEYGAGKTQLCHTLCVVVQLPPEQGGLGGNALYIDTEGTFRPERIIQIAQGIGIDPNEVLRKIVVARAFNSDHQILIIEKIDELIEKKNIKIIIVDSVISHFRAEYLGRETLAIRQQRLNSHLHRLLRIAEVYNIPVVVTNQVISSPDVFFGPTDKPAGGHIIAHLSTNRVFIRKSKKNLRIAKIIDSPYLPEAECPFIISEQGIEDAPE